MADRIGQQLGNYRLTRWLGQGGFADVYLGEHIHLSTQAAIKVLQMRLVGSNMEQFRHEAQIIASLMHPHIVRILDFGVEGGIPFLVMDYAPNGTLRQRHPKGTRLSSVSIVPSVRQVALALQYAHDRKLIHRDVKPENMLLGLNENVLLSDFGLVLTAQSTSAQTTKEMAGTLPYMAPEQINGKPRFASDQYSLGIVIYEWLSGHCPFRGSFVEVATQHLMTPPAPLYGRVPQVSPALQEVVFTALAKDPQQRFASMQAFATAFEQAAQTVPPDPLLVSQPMRLSSASALSTFVDPSLGQSGQSPLRGPAPSPLSPVGMIETSSSPFSQSTFVHTPLSPSSQSTFVDPSLGQSGQFPLREPAPSPLSPAGMIDTSSDPSSQSTLLSPSSQSTFVHTPLRPSSQSTFAFTPLPTAVDPTPSETQLFKRDLSFSLEREQRPVDIAAQTTFVSKSGASQEQTDRPMPLSAQAFPVSIPGRRRWSMVALLMVLVVLLVGGGSVVFGKALFGRMNPTPTASVTATATPHLTAAANSQPTAAVKPTAAGKSQPTAAGKSQPTTAAAPTPTTPAAPTPTTPAAPTPTTPAAPTPTTPAAPTPTTPAAPTPTATVALNADPYPPYSGTLTLYDPLQDNSRGYRWNVFPTDSYGTSCQFIGGAYHVIELQNYLVSCMPSLRVRNFTFEVQMQIITGHCGTLQLLGPATKAVGYYFDVCRDGSYTFYRSDSATTANVTLTSGSSTAIIAGLKQSNMVAVVANGSNFDLYINQQKIGSVYDSTYSQGVFGVGVDGKGEVAYTNARMWTL